MKRENKSILGRVTLSLSLCMSLLGVVFGAELLVMSVLPWLSITNRVVENFVDAFLLALLIAPFLWLLIVRPLRSAALSEMSRSEAMLDQVVDGVAFLGRNGVVETFNKAAERIFGYCTSDVAGKEISVLFPELGGNPSGGLDLADKGVFRQETVGLHRHGHLFPVDLSVSRVKVDNRDKFICIMRDVTERKEAEEALAERSRELVRSNAELEQFAYAISHDLREPLRMIHVFLQLLEKRYRGKLDHDADEFITFAVDGAARMQKLISDLLDYSRVGSRGMELAPVDCGAALGQALDNLRLAIEESGASVTAGPLPTVAADESQLVRLFQNLIGNAVKFRGKEPLRVHVGAELRDEEWLFSVRDNGIGIAPEYFEKIFLIFKRVYSQSEYPGTGIGLAVCKKIVERHGGRIWVESEPGKGATFLFSMPTMRTVDNET